MCVCAYVLVAFTCGQLLPSEQSLYIIDTDNCSAIYVLVPVTAKCRLQLAGVMSQV